MILYSISHLLYIEFGISCDSGLFDMFVCDFTKDGTNYYMSPEMLSKNNIYNFSKSFGMKLDIWSLTIVLYQILYGINDFKKYSINSLVSKPTIFVQQTMKFNDDKYKRYNDLIKKMLNVNPNQRPSIKEIKKIWGK